MDTVFPKKHVVGRDPRPAFVRWIVSGNAHGWWVIAPGAQTPIADGMTEDGAYALAEVLDTYRQVCVFNNGTISGMQKRALQLEETLRNCQEYFDGKADAEYTGDPAEVRGNREMHLFVEITSLIGPMDKEPDHSIPADAEEGEQAGYGTPSQEEYEHEQELERQQARMDALVDSYQDGDLRDARNYPQDEGFA